MSQPFLTSMKDTLLEEHNCPLPAKIDRKKVKKTE